MSDNISRGDQSKEIYVFEPNADPWPVLCPACAGEPYFTISNEDLRHYRGKYPFFCKVLLRRPKGTKPKRGHTWFQCSRCDGKGTIIGE